jgi:PTS system sucrose-specific IIC component
MSDALRQLANVFIPLIPAFIASGLITGIINILKRPDIVGDLPPTIRTCWVFWDLRQRRVRHHEHSGRGEYREGVWRIAGDGRGDGGHLSSPQLAQITLFGEALQPGAAG